MINKYFLKQFFFIFKLLILMLLSGCATISEPEDKTILATLAVIADPNLNPAVDGRASPIVIRIYQLNQTARFDNSDFFALYENDQAVLADELQVRTELEIKPDEKYRNQLEIKPDTRFIAVLAAFRDLDNSQWKAIANFSPDDNQALTVYVNKNSVEIKID